MNKSETKDVESASDGNESEIDNDTIVLREYIKSRQHFVEEMFELLTLNVKIKIFFLKYFVLFLQLVMSTQMFSLEYTQVYLELVYVYNYIM